MKIGNKIIGEKPYIIAEFGVNHNGSLERAKEGIISAAKSGADAIKFQTYTADELVVKGTPKFWDAESKVDEGLDQYQAYKALEGFKKEWYPELVKCCEENNIEFLSTPFSIEGADFLNELGMKAFKIASSDLGYLQMIEHIAKFNKPILLSTGASTMEEIHEAVETIEKYHKQIIILHCTLCYPTKPEDANFNLITTLQKEFPEYPIGLSDHTLGVGGAIASKEFGATVIEKHYTVDKTLDKSADHWLSVDPLELQYIVETYIDNIGNFGGSYKKKIFPCEEQTRLLDKRSVVSKVEIPKGTRITKEMLTCKRPGTGIPPKEMDMLIGLLSTQDIKEDTTLLWEMF